MANDLLQYVENVRADFRKWLDENSVQVEPESLGIDRRAVSKYHLRVTDDAVLVHNDAVRGFDYYGGGEYVDREYRTQMCDWHIYWCDDPRVAEWLERHEENA